MGKDSNTYDRLYADLIKRHEKIIFSVCFFYASSSVLFDDLKQEVFISLYKREFGIRNALKKLNRQLKKSCRFFW